MGSSYSRIIASVLIASTASTLASCKSDPTTTTDDGADGTGGNTETQADYKSWSVPALSDSLDRTGSSTFIFMEEASMRGIYFELDIEASDDRADQARDAIYYIHEGSGVVSVDGVTKEVEQGEIFFTKGGMKLEFTEVSTPLKVVMITLTNPANSTAPLWQSFSRNSTEALRDPTSNVWNPFIRFSNVILGLYMLPQGIGGDSRLVHTWQELNIITSGSGRFRMDSDEIEVDVGSIFFVEEGNGHFFRNLTSDLDILILWEQP